MKKQAFTLVELIVVTTILAILGTIAFISLSGYSKEARDSKRITDTSSILSKINIEFVKGQKLSNLIIKDKDNNLTIKSSSNPGFQGIPNYEVLKEDYKNFRDPTNNQIYPFAYTIGGTGSGAYTFMQMATVSESEGRARLMGNYFKFEDNDSPSLFTSSGTTGTNIPGDYLEDNGIELPYNIGMQVAPLVCNTGYQEVNNRCVAIVCGTGKYLEGNECKDIICSTGKYLDGNDCIEQWSGDITNGYTFKSSSGVVIYPTSCNNLLTDNRFKVGTTGAYNGTKFKDGVYYIKPDSNPAFKAYCDMTTDSGGWTVILNTSSNEKTNFSPLETGYDLAKSWSWTRIYANKLSPTNASILYAEGNFQKLTYNSTYQAFYNGSYAVQISLDNCQARMGNRCSSNTATRASWGYFCRVGNPFTAGGGNSFSAFPGNYPYQNSDNLGSIKCDSSSWQTNGTEFGTRVMLR